VSEALRNIQSQAILLAQLDREPPPLVEVNCDVEDAAACTTDELGLFVGRTLVVQASERSSLPVCGDAHLRNGWIQTSPFELVRREDPREESAIVEDRLGFNHEATA
jgi:hypothetical protein